MYIRVHGHIVPHTLVLACPRRTKGREDPCCCSLEVLLIHPQSVEVVSMVLPFSVLVWENLCGEGAFTRPLSRKKPGSS